MSIRHKALLKCNCGKTVAKGSVFCPHCRAEINRQNVITMNKEERKFQKKMRGKGTGKKK